MFCSCPGNTDIQNGNVKLILGLIWCLIAHYQLGASNFPPKKLMLAWLKVRSYCTVHRLFMLAWLKLRSNRTHSVVQYTSSCWPGPRRGHTVHRLLYSIQARAGLAQGGAIQYTECCTPHKLTLAGLKNRLMYCTYTGCGPIHRLKNITQASVPYIGCCGIHRLHTTEAVVQ
jgi:hypothetical protein